MLPGTKRRPFQVITALGLWWQGDYLEDIATKCNVSRSMIIRFLKEVELHRSKPLRRQVLKKERKPREICKESNCNTLSRCRDYCNVHYQRMKRKGLL